MKKIIWGILILSLHMSYASAHSVEDGMVTYKAAEEARISLHQAIDMAEKQSGGKVTRIYFNLRSNVWVYDAEVQTAGGTLQIEIDAASGVLRPAPPLH